MDKLVCYACNKHYIVSLFLDTNEYMFLKKPSLLFVYRYVIKLQCYYYSDFFVIATATFKLCCVYPIFMYIH